MSTEFTKKDIAEILDLSVRKITFWTDSGLVIPDVKPSRGKGKARVYSARNLLEFAMIDILINQVKISLNNIRYVFESLRRGYQREMNEELTTQYLVKYGFPPRFETFFDDSDWGKQKELIYVEWLMQVKAVDNLVGPIQSFWPVDEKSDFNEFFKFNSEYTYGKILYLGQIKNMALKKVGLHM